MKTSLYTFFIFASLIIFGFKELEAKMVDCTVKAKAAIIFNPDTETIVFKKNSDEPHYPASIMKIATAAYVLEKGLDLKTLCTVSPGAIQVINAPLKQANPLSYPAYILEHDGVTVGLKVGRSYSLDTLLHGLLLMSGNDAANVIAENVSGSIDKFMAELNDYLKGKGICQTRFQNPHGLYHPAQLTTAYDMARIGKLAFDHPLFLKMIKSSGYEDEGFTFENRNPLLKEGKYRYPKVLGGKTGYTSHSGFNLVACAEHEGRRLIVVLLGCASSQERSEDAIALFETAFREKSGERLLFCKGQGPFIHKEKGWKGHLKEDVSIVYYPSEETPLTTEIAWEAQPKNGKVGSLVVKNGAGVALATAPLYLTKNDESSNVHWIVWGLGSCVGLALFIQLLKKGRKFLKR